MKTSSFRTKNNNQYYVEMDQSKNSVKGGLSQRRNNMTMNNYNLSQSKVSNASSSKLQNKTRFQDRLQKACQTYAPEAMKKQINLMKKQIERLEKESLKKDKRILQMQSAHSLSRQLQAQAQIEQTYRLVYFYEGKIIELQNQLRRLQKKLANNIDKTIEPEQVQGLLLQYRNDNGDLRGTIQEQNRVISQLEDHIKELQTKYFSTSWKLATKNRTLANPLKKKFPNLRQNIILKEMPLLQKQKIKLEMNQKFGQTQKRITDIQDQNRRLKNELSVSKTKASINMTSFNNNNTNIANTTSNHADKNIQQNTLLWSSYAQNSKNNASNLQYLPPKSPNHYKNTTNLNVKSSSNNRGNYYVGLNNDYTRNYTEQTSRQQSPRVVQRVIRRQSPRVIRIQNLGYISQDSSQRSPHGSSYHKLSSQSQQRFYTPYQTKIRNVQIQ